MKHLILFLILSFSVLLNAGGVSFVQYIENYATFYPFDGTQPEELKNGLPLYPGDKINSQRNTFIEISLSDQNILWVGSFSELELRAISGTEGYPDKRTYLFLNSGEIAYEAIQVPSYNEEPVIGFPQGDLYILGQGVYYVSINNRGNVRVMIIEGKAEIATSEGSVYLRSGEEANVFSDGYIDRKRISLKNEFFVEMVEQRRALRYKSQSSQYTGRQLSSSNYILDSYGSWIYEPEFSLYVWRPTVVVGWSPYYDGYWRWTPHGWFWVSYEPWGYLTYHYGRWVWTPRYGWVWVPGYTWAPAWVYWFWFDDYFAWCPMGYYDYWWYYRWDWWWSWPPCWYNDCYFDFKGKVNLMHLHRDFWIFADGRNFGKTNLQIHKGLKIDLKGKDGLIYAINLPVGLKDISKLNEHFLTQKNILKNDLSPVFKLNDKPTLEAKNILSGAKHNFSNEKNFLKIDNQNLKRDNVFENLKPSRGLKPSPNNEKGIEKGNTQPRVLEKPVLEKENRNFPKDQPSVDKDKPKIEQKREPLKLNEPKKDVGSPREIENENKTLKKDSSNSHFQRDVISPREIKNENQPLKRDSSNDYYQRTSPKREPVSNYEIKEQKPTSYQPQYYRTPQTDSKTPAYTPRNYTPPPDRGTIYQPNSGPSYTPPTRSNSPSQSTFNKTFSTSSSSSSTHSSSSSNSSKTSSSSSHSSSSHSSSSSSSSSGKIKTK